MPLIVLDYPGECADGSEAFGYVTAQHKDLISRMEQLSGNTLDESRLAWLIDCSRASVREWERVISLLPEKDITPTILFDAVSFLITARCKPETAEFFKLMYEEFSQMPDADRSKPPVFWLGYPLWYHPDRYLAEVLGKCRVCGSNYITWWSLDYSGGFVMEKLYHAYNFTFLNLLQETRSARVKKCIRRSGAQGAVVLHNKSCKCDFVSAWNIDIPQIELEIDMIDREFLNLERARQQMVLLMESLCTG